MNYSLALSTLNIQKTNSISIKLVEHQYKLLARQYHPDKNLDKDTSKFILVKEARDYLCDRVDNHGNISNTTYFTDNKFIVADFIVTHAMKCYEIIIIDRLENMKYEQQFIVFSLVDKYKSMFSIEFINYIDKLRTNYNQNQESEKDSQKKKEYTKTQKEEIPEYKYTKESSEKEIYHIYPTIDELWDNVMYRLCINNQKITVPVWNDESIYDNFTIVRNLTIDTDKEDIWLDHDNNLHTNITLSITDIWQACHCINKDEDEDITKIDTLKINIGKKIFSIKASSITLAKYQLHTFIGQGILKSECYVDIMYNRGDVFIHLFITR